MIIIGIESIVLASIMYVKFNIGKGIRKINREDSIEIGIKVLRSAIYGTILYNLAALALVIYALVHIKTLIEIPLLLLIMPLMLLIFPMTVIPVIIVSIVVGFIAGGVIIWLVLIQIMKLNGAIRIAVKLRRRRWIYLLLFIPIIDIIAMIKYVKW